MKPSLERNAVAVLIGLSGLAAAGLAMVGRWPVGKPFPPLLYQVVPAGASKAGLFVLGVAGLVTAVLVQRGTRAGWLLMLAGLAWDAACQAAGLSSGQPSAALFLLIDVLLAGYVFARKPLFGS